MTTHEPADDEAGILQRTIISELDQATGAAREALARVDNDRDTAVHEVRKGLRRMRAITNLVADALPTSDRRAIRDEIRRARRTLGPARDHAVATRVLSELPLDEADRASLRGIVQAESEEVPSPSDIGKAVVDGVTCVVTQAEVLRAALPEALEWSIVVRGAQQAYRAARRARKAAKQSKRAFHTWRRRNKELAYQLDVLARCSGERVEELRREIAAVNDAQGAGVDLIMVLDLVRRHPDVVDSHASQQLDHALRSHLKPMLKATRRSARDAFQREPRNFGRRLKKAVRRDLVSRADDPSSEASA